MHYTDQELVEAIQAGGSARERALDAVYRKYFSMVRKNIGKHQLQYEHIQEAYCDALLHFSTAVANGKFQYKGALQGFFAIIFRNKCIDVLRRNATIPLENAQAFQWDLPDADASTPEQALVEAEDSAEADRNEALRADCLRLAASMLKPEENRFLEDFYVRDFKPRELVERYGYKSARVVSSTAVELKKKLVRALYKVCEEHARCRALCAALN